MAEPAFQRARQNRALDVVTLELVVISDSNRRQGIDTIFPCGRLLLLGEVARQTNQPGFRCRVRRCGIPALVNPSTLAMLMMLLPGCITLAHA